MKYVISLAVVLTLCLATANAQEPVETCATSSATIEMAERPASDLNDNYQPMELKDASFPSEQDVETLMEEYVLHPDQTTASILNILLGDFGVGHFYTGQTLRGVLDVVFCWTGIPALIGFVEGIIWLCDDDEEWEARVAKWNR